MIPCITAATGRGALRASPPRVDANAIASLVTIVLGPSLTVVGAMGAVPGLRPSSPILGTDVASPIVVATPAGRGVATRPVVRGPTLGQEGTVGGSVLRRDGAGRVVLVTCMDVPRVRVTAIVLLHSS